MTNNEYLTVINALVDRVAYLEEYADDLKTRAEDAEADFAQAEEARALLKAKLDGQIVGAAKEQSDAEKRIDSMMDKIGKLEDALAVERMKLLETETEFRNYQHWHTEANDKLRQQIAIQREFIKRIRPELAEHLAPWDYDQIVDLFNLPDIQDNLPPFEIPDEFFNDNEEDETDDN